MEAIKFTVDGTPQGKGRARSYIRQGRIGHYTPEKTRLYEETVSMIAKAAMRGMPPIDGAVSVSIIADFPIPKNWTKAKKEDAKWGQIKPTGKPDIDNIAKAIFDGCNGVVWVDDAQVVNLNLKKRYNAYNVGVTVVIEKIY